MVERRRVFRRREKAGGRTEDVGGIAPWIEPLPVPSRTPFVGAMLKRKRCDAGL